jgi:hypothetical protein
MIRHDFQRKNQPIVSSANLAHQFLDPRFRLTNENFPPVSWTEHEIIVDERYGCFRMTIFFCHTMVVSA